MGLAQAKQDALADRIADLSFDGAGWLGAARGDALTRLSAMGLPGKRDEYWRYSDPATLISAAPALAKAFNPGDEAPAFEAIDCVKLVFVDGVFDAAASDDLSLAGVQIERLAQIAAPADHWACDL